MTSLSVLKEANRRFIPVYIVVFVFLLISLLTRIALLIYSAGSLDLSVKNILGIFFIGFFYDLCVASFLIIPFILHIWFTSNRTYEYPWKWIATGIYLVLIFLIAFTNIIPKEFSGAIPKVVLAFVILRFAIYLFLLYRGKEFRIKWRKVVLQFDFFLLVFLLTFNAVSEFFFWDEFGTRYNFIAVDYLIYTNEVVGNIKESYPLYRILLLVFLFSVFIWWPLKKKIARSVNAQTGFLQRSVISAGLLLLPILVYFFANNSYKEFSRNTYNNELAGNGIYEFSNAFFRNELDFYQFYKTLPDDEAFRIMRKELDGPSSHFISDDIYNLEREIKYPDTTKKYNIVLITVESFSASFMGAFGNKQNITPQLDSLSQKGIFFTKLYASGTRTVRGLEALALSIPPPPGQSIVKRPGNENLFSLGAILKEHNYNTSYIYGGYSYFDNMKHFYENNGYRVIDRDALKFSEIHYANIWGVADEDMFTLALNKLDEDYQTGRPFFSQIMTVSNHRPYTYPKGRIDLNPDDQSREGAVKYTDYAIGRFIREASVKPWFDNTIFIIVADHCAKAGGKVELPVEGYHIPMIIYAPKIITPQKFDRLTAQIDIAPTILGLLKLNYRTKFFGRDILNYPPGNDQAFISTFQGLGYLTNDHLLVLMPPKKTNQFKPDFISGKSEETPVNDSLAKVATAYYQAAAWVFRNNKFGFRNMK